MKPGLGEGRRRGKLMLAAHCVLNRTSHVFGLAGRAGTIGGVVKVLMITMLE